MLKKVVSENQEDAAEHTEVMITTLKKNPEEIMNNFSALTSLEQNIISIFWKNSQALTVQDIRTKLIQNTYEHITLLAYSKIIFPFPDYIELSDIDLNRLRIDYETENARRRASFPKDMTIEDFIKHTKLPSFRTIKEIIFGLVKLKIVNSRPSFSKKETGLYYLNPELRGIMQSVKPDSYTEMTVQKLEEPTKRSNPHINTPTKTK